MSIAKGLSLQSERIKRPGANVIHNELITMLRVSRKSALPHPEWKPWHDAILVRAIVKHGWIDRCVHYTSMVEDDDLDWREPFKLNKEKAKSEEPSATSQQVEDSQILKDVALRAADFLNHVGVDIEKLKGFNKKMIPLDIG